MCLKDVGFCAVTSCPLPQIKPVCTADQAKPGHPPWEAQVLCSRDSRFGSGLGFTGAL